MCDVVEPWEHGTVVRATRYPTYYSYNLVRVEDEPGVDAEELVAFADRALEGLEHRRLEFDVVEAGEARRAALVARGFRSMRLLWMRHEQPPPGGAALTVEEVPYDAVAALRRTWYEEGLDGGTYDESFGAAAREVAIARGALVLACSQDGDPVGFAQLERAGDAAEISQVYVLPELRGRGYGTAMTRAAILAAGDVSDLWIVADDEDRPKDLYARLGFRGVWRSMEFELVR